MRWVKHDTDANMDAKMQVVLLDYGLEGYGLYWYCIELIARKISPENTRFRLEHDVRIIAKNTGSAAEKVTEILECFIELGLFERTDGFVTCMKLAKRLDNSMTSNPELRKVIAQVKSKPVKSMAKNKKTKTQPVNPMTESASPMTESANPMTESANPMTESANPMTESAKPMTESAKPMQEKRRIEEKIVDTDNDITPPVKSVPAAHKKQTQKFVKPTLDEAAQYFFELGSGTCREDAHRFVDHYDSNGWQIGGRSAMKDWKAAIRKWYRNSLQYNEEKKNDPKDKSTAISGRPAVTFTDTNF